MTSRDPPKLPRSLTLIDAAPERQACFWIWRQPEARKDFSVATGDAWGSVVERRVERANKGALRRAQVPPGGWNPEHSIEYLLPGSHVRRDSSTQVVALTDVDDLAVQDQEVHAHQPLVLERSAVRSNGVRVAHDAFRFLGAAGGSPQNTAREMPMASAIFSMFS